MADLTRRRLVLHAPAAAVGLSACKTQAPPAAPTIRFVGQSADRGHALRDGSLRALPITTRVETDVVIVGAGAAGAAAAWRLARAGITNVHVLELETGSGGTARGGELPAGRYPMGAHYLPAPHPEFTALKTLLMDLGVARGEDPSGALDLDPTAVCAAPLERHHHEGRWHEGLYPALGQTAEEAKQWEEFREHLRALDQRRGADGRRLFALPLRSCSDELRHLDAMDMATYLDRHGFTSWRLRWVVDYACRDDYGLALQDTSAFAALHHFLARGLEEDRDAAILTWPNGNDFLVQSMLSKAGLGDRLHTDHAALVVSPDGAVTAHDFGTGQNTLLRAKVVLWAAPRFLLPFVLPPKADPLPRGALPYGPWLTASLSLKKPPGGFGAPLSWDNVATGAEHLGYVVATHGRSRADLDPRCVITFYEPWAATAGADPAAARTRLLSTGLDAHVAALRKNLEAMHPGIWSDVEAVDVARFGHAMIRPEPGLLFGETLASARAPIGNVLPCGTDTSGLPLFEEAFAAGITAAEDACARLGHPTKSLL